MVSGFLTSPWDQASIVSEEANPTRIRSKLLTSNNYINSRKKNFLVNLWIITQDDFVIAEDTIFGIDAGNLEMTQIKIQVCVVF